MLGVGFWLVDDLGFPTSHFVSSFPYNPSVVFPHNSRLPRAPDETTFARLYPAAIRGKVNFNLVAMKYLHPIPTALLLVPPLSTRFPHILFARSFYDRITPSADFILVLFFSFFLFPFSFLDGAENIL